MRDLKDRVRNDFTYHAPTPEMRPRFLAIREKARELAELFVDLVPVGREQVNALTRLEEAVFHANAGIAREGVPEMDMLTTGLNA